ncbi:MAG TPA: hypothetical protein VKS79_18250 [Gemmataceae bacterium]|nr:hypothetical protein [Gemmataceae bacterium]
MDYLLPTILILALAGFGCRIGRRKPTRQTTGDRSGAVHEQHLYLFQGGQLSESEVESARVAIEKELKDNRPANVLAAMKAGTGFAVWVQALGQIRTFDAASILEKQLQHSITTDPQEQAWYWLDATRALRQLERNDCLPMLSACVARAPAPLDQFLAAEAVCFSGFIDFLHEGDAAKRRLAARLLHLSLVGLRSGVQPHVVVHGRLGEAVSALWEQRWEEVDPVAVRCFREALRVLQRAGYLERLAGEDELLCERLQEQIRQLDVLAEPIADWLDEARVALVQRLSDRSADEQIELLRAAVDLRCDTAAVVLPLLEADRLGCPDLAIESLAYARKERIGAWLCRWLKQRGFAKNWNSWRGWGKFNHVGKEIYLAVLRTLRHHPCAEAEKLLVEAGSSHDPSIRTAALSSLGWLEPLDRSAVLRCLHQGRFAHSSAVQRAAQAALARLGERQALQWFRQQLAAESSDRVHHILDLIGREGIVLLWPDLDHLADAEDRDIAHHACETLELLREDFIFCAPVR